MIHNYQYELFADGYFDENFLKILVEVFEIFVKILDEYLVD